jgi:hypothetical protein
MKIYHEAPLRAFDLVQQYTDGDYALVHLLKNPTYKRAFKLAKLNDREIILDNSVFELGQAYDDSLFAAEVERMEPTWYIVPDVLSNMDGTLERFRKFVNKHPELPGGRVGVVQGSSNAQLLRCYEQLEPHCDMIAFSFDYVHWGLAIPQHESKWHAYMEGRREFLNNYQGFFNKDKPHHLLGCALPQEFVAYPRNWDWLYSVDTSNPVVHGMLGIAYSPEGLYSKSTIKLAEMIDSDVNAIQCSRILHNIDMFRRFCNG